nr:hypothetical protein BaRGS_026140 [Batillaria attramentaria]
MEEKRPLKTSFPPVLSQYLPENAPEESSPREASSVKRYVGCVVCFRVTGRLLRMQAVADFHRLLQLELV